MRETIALGLVTLMLAAPALADDKTGGTSGKVIWEEGEADIKSDAGKVIWEEAEADVKSSKGVIVSEEQTEI